MAKYILVPIIKNLRSSIIWEVTVMTHLLEMIDIKHPTQKGLTIQSMSVGLPSKSTHPRENKARSTQWAYSQGSHSALHGQAFPNSVPSDFFMETPCKRQGRNAETHEKAFSHTKLLKYFMKHPAVQLQSVFNNSSSTSLNEVCKCHAITKTCTCLFKLIMYA